MRQEVRSQVAGGRFHTVGWEVRAREGEFTRWAWRTGRKGARAGEGAASSSTCTRKGRTAATACSPVRGSCEFTAPVGEFAVLLVNMPSQPVSSLGRATWATSREAVTP
eukprot:5984373-Pyramimonas_sp.AAC.4